jgi:hypothetical protein
MATRLKQKRRKELARVRTALKNNENPLASEENPFCADLEVNNAEKVVLIAAAVNGV